MKIKQKTLRSILAILSGLLMVGLASWVLLSHARLGDSHLAQIFSSSGLSINPNANTSLNINSFQAVGNTGQSISVCTPSNGVMRITARGNNLRSFAVKNLIGYKTLSGTGTHYLTNTSNASIPLKGQRSGLAPAWAYAEIDPLLKFYEYTYDWDFAAQSIRTASISSTGTGITLPIQKLYFIQVAADSANNALFGGSVTGEVTVNPLTPCPNSNPISTSGTNQATVGTKKSAPQGLIKVPTPFTYKGNTVYPVYFEKGETLDSVCARFGKVAKDWYDDVEMFKFATGGLPVVNSVSGDDSVATCGAQQTGICANPQNHDSILNCSTCTNKTAFGSTTQNYAHKLGACMDVPSTSAAQNTSTVVISTQQTGTPRQSVNGSCKAGFSANLSHSAVRDTEMGIAVSTDNGFSYSQATLSSATSSLSGVLAVDNARNVYQIEKIQTSSGQTVTVDYEVDLAGLLRGQSSSSMKFKVLTRDTSGNTSESSTNAFSVDCTQPAAFGPVVVTDILQSTARVGWTTLSSDPNFAGYQISVGTDVNDVNAFTGTAQMGTISSVSATSIGLTGLNPNTDYFTAVRALDKFGNAAMAGSKSFKTLAIGSGGTTVTNPTVPITIPTVPAPILCSLPSCSGGSTTVITTPATFDPVTGKKLTCAVVTCQAGTGTGTVPVVLPPTGGSGGSGGTGGTGGSGGTGGTGTGISGDVYDGTWQSMQHGSNGPLNIVLDLSASGTVSFALNASGGLFVPSLSMSGQGSIVNGFVNGFTSSPQGTLVGNVYNTNESFLFFTNFDNMPFAATITGVFSNNRDDLSGHIYTYPKGTQAAIFTDAQCDAVRNSGGICDHNTYTTKKSGSVTSGSAPGTGGTGGTGGSGTGTGTGGSGGSGTGTGTGTAGAGTGTGGSGGSGTGTGGTGTGGTGTGGTGTGTGTGGSGGSGGSAGTGGSGSGTGGAGTGTGGTGTGIGGSGTGTGGAGPGGLGGSGGVGGSGTGGSGTGTGGTGSGSGGSGGSGRSRSTLSNGASNCFDQACSNQEEMSFIETANKIGEAFSSSQQEVLDFIDILDREGMTAEEMSTDFVRRGAVFIAIQILRENGIVTDADIDSVLTTGFPDVALNSRFGKEIGYAKQIGIIDGLPNGNFAPDQALTLAQAYKILGELMARLDNSVSSQLGVAALDVSVDWFHKYVSALSIYIPTFSQYDQLGQRIGGVFYMTLLNEVLNAVGIDNPLSGVEATIGFQG